MQGKYPPNLAALVPRYLPRIPVTGLGSRRPFHYCSKTTNAPAANPAEQFLSQSPYVLVVECVPGGTLVFRPGGNYRDLGTYDMVNGWAWTNID